MSEYEIFFSPSAAKDLRDLPKQIQQRIDEKFVSLAQDPRPFGSIKLKGADDLYRFRVGDYRVIYEIADEKLIVLVIKIAHRKEVYR
jgi:mRNA interferase RelE/StbE